MRVLVTTFPAKGHFHPVAPLALALGRAGHDVRVATGADLLPWVQGCGLTVMSAGRSEKELVAAAGALSQAERPIRLFTTIAVPAFATDVLASTGSWRPDLVVNEEGEFGGPLIASVLGVPSATHSWPAPAQPTEARAALRSALDDVWQSFGQPGPARIYGEHYLDCCPPPLQTTEIDTIAGVMAVRPSLFDGPPMVAPTWLDDLVPPVVFVTLGTVPLFARPESLRLIVESVRSMAGTVVVATGPSPAAAMPTHPNVRVVRYLPLSAILPKADLVISHGGASTTVACLLHGTRHLVVPQGAPSQRRMATSVAALGVGRALDDQCLDAATLTSAAAEILGDANILARIDAVRTAIDDLPGPDSTARYLVDLL